MLSSVFNPQHHHKMTRTGAMKKKGEAGAAKNYTTRNQAIKKLQCTLSDFRRLCILKGIYPREPRSRKKANKGSSAPASFYYAKDIQYLLHEPVLGKLREHKAFAKKLSKALGRGEWSLAKNLEESKPVYRIDHIIKERYPTFTDSLRDVDDALSLIVLFACLPATPSVPAAIIANCAKLAAQWQLYVMRTKSLRKVFLSIKGIYFQAEVQGQTITWLVPYMFTQNIPSDLDYRIMLTFLELYQTLLGFVFYKLYTDINLVYPPKLDEALDEGGAGIGALLLEESGKSLIVVQDTEVGEGEKEKKRVYAKDVRNKIREIGTGDDQASGEDEEMVSSTIAEVTSQELDVFIAPSSTNAVDHIPQPLSSASTSNLFSSYFFYLSREVTRPTLEFVLRSFSGQVGWDSTLGAGSPFTENDPKITHHVVDRPLAAGVTYDHPGKRSYVQPQWVIDCVNKGRLLPTGDYAPGKTLPPHLSPFVDEDVVRERGGYVPMEAEGGARKQLLDEEEDDEDEDEHEEMDDQEEDDEVEQELVTKKKGKKAPSKALLAAAQDPDNLTLLHAAELEAEAAGIAPDQFEKELKDVTKKVGGGAKKSSGRNKKEEEQLASIVLTGKQKKLYKKMQWSQDRREEDTAKLELRRKQVEKERKKASLKQAL